MPNEVTPIFYDASRKRWKRFQLGSIFLSGGIVLLLSILVISFYFLPTRLGFFGTNSSTHHKVLPHLPQLFPAGGEILEKERLSSALKRRTVNKEILNTQIATSTAIIAAFFDGDNNGSFESLKNNLSKVNILFPRWATLDNKGQTIYDSSDSISQVLKYISSKKSPIVVMPVISNLDDDGWNKAAADNLLSNLDVRKVFFDKAILWAKTNNFGGITIDIEGMSSPQLYSDFIKNASYRMHESGLKLVVVVSPDQREFPYAQIASSADYVTVPLYDENYKSPGPIASAGWMYQILEKRSLDIPSEKLIPIIGTHSYDWSSKGLPQKETFEEALLAAKESSAEIHFDSSSLSPAYTYYDNSDLPHQVWMEDAATAFNTYILSQDYSNAIAIENLGDEDAEIWKFIDNPNPDKLLSTFESFKFNYLVDYEGKGEILQINDTASDNGQRKVTYDAQSGLIDDETYLKYPSPYTIEHHGASSSKVVALTFDDGPDDRYTPDILDILKQKQVPATFFVVGEQAQLFPELIRREHTEGHTIGNHTYTHPDIANVTLTQIKLELSATERLIESLTGRQTVLFRAPYASDGEPDTPSQILPALTASKMGYLFVGMNIDPEDWRATSSQEIIDSTLSQAKKGDGNVILLHDGGANRTLTVAALSKLIDTLRAEGYQFVPLSTLIGRSQDELMPTVSSTQRLLFHIDAIGFGFLRFVSSFLRVIFIGAIVLGIARFFLLAPLAIREFFLSKKRKFDENYHPSVAVIIAAYNEEKVIVRTIEHILASEYGSSFEVIIVNDGSKDKTLEVIHEKFGSHPHVKILTQANAGKSHALNYGLSQTAAEIIVTLDADTLFLPQTVSKLVRHFYDPQVAGVAGNAKVGNRINLLTRWQSLEYIASQNLDKRAFALLNCIIVVPGAVGAWRKAVISQLGFFATDTLAEDTDLTLSVEKLGYKVLYEEDAIALTEAPDTTNALIKQRYRWTYGTYQACFKHRDAFLNPKNGLLGFVTFPNIILFQILLPLISPILDLFVIITIFSLWITWAQHPEDILLGPLLSVLFYYFIFLIFDYLIAGLAFLLEKKEDWSLLVWLLLQRFYYRQLMYYIAIKSIISSVRGGSVGWNHLERKSTVKITPTKL